MTVVSKGYAGPVTSEDWASLVRGLPKRYWVEHSSSAQVTAVTGVDRTVRVNLGKVGGWGIFDEVTVAEDVQINQDLPTPGNSTWYLIALRRDWGLGTTSVAIITGTASQAIPVREQDPGTGQDDQPLALVQITGGTSEPTAVSDLRAWGGDQGFMQANNLLFQQYIEWQGAQIRFGGLTYGYSQPTPGQGETGTWEITRNAPTKLSGSAQALASEGAGWDGFDNCRLYRDDKRRDLYIEVTRSGSTLTSNEDNGNFAAGDHLIGTLDSQDWPHAELPMAAFAEVVVPPSGVSSVTVMAGVRIDTTGGIYLHSLLPDWQINNSLPSKLYASISYWTE